MHPDEDVLLKFVLQTLDDDEQRIIESHLRECAECRSAVDRIRRETDLIASFDPETELPAFSCPKPRSRTTVVLLRAAALLLIGFLAGYTTSFLSGREYQNIIPYRVQSTRDSRPLDQFTTCESIDINIGRIRIEPIPRSDSL